MNNPEIWWLPILLYILTAYIGIRIWQKTIVGLPSRTRRLALQYVFCLIFAIIFWILGGFALQKEMFLIAGLGALSGLGSLFQWKAVDISLSKSSLLTFTDDIVAMGLSFFILKEGGMISAQTGVGILICLAVAILFGLHSFKKGTQTKRFFIYVATFSIFWGIAMFGTRFFAFNEIAIAQFVVSWYLGSTISALLLLWLYKDKDINQQGGAKLGIKDYLNLFGFAGGIFLCLGIEYSAYKLAPLIVVQPFFLLGEAILPTLVGLFLFKEMKSFDRKEWILGSIGLIGLILISTGFK